MGLVDSGGGPVVEVDLFEQPVADAPDPADRAGAADEFVECVHGLWQGGWSMDFGPPGSAPNPEEAVLLFLKSWSLPTSNYTLAGRDENRVLYTHLVEGIPKIAVIVADSTQVELDADAGWVVETFAACDPAEYDPSTDDEIPMDIWLDADNQRVPTSIITSRQGPEHCNWESVTFLTFDDRQYIRDPRGVLARVGFTAYDENAELPETATNTGYHREGRQLWMSADRTTAYVVDNDRVEAWGTTDEPIGCA
ncbi:MAG: hypothetical protein WB239_14740 [Acidimicrobiia bacterium]